MMLLYKGDPSLLLNSSRMNSIVNFSFESPWFIKSVNLNSISVELTHSVLYLKEYSLPSFLETIDISKEDSLRGISSIVFENSATRTLSSDMEATLKLGKSSQTSEVKKVPPVQKYLSSTLH